MAVWNDFWGGLSRPARAGFVAGALLIVLAVAGLGWSILRTDYGVLFSELSDRDMAAMAAELDKQKVAYRVDERARSLLVPQDQVHKVRMKLMGTPVALHGAVGFELFNNADFAMTEFAQKVNYQRALQGELTRTILSLEEVQSARVHLALPEQGLFRKATSKAKASVTLQLKPGHSLGTEQVAGIQRLVAASVADITAPDVAVLDQHGVVLSRAGLSEEGGLATAAGLDLKQSTEAYLARKATQVVDRLFGPGEALVSVDAALVHDQTRITTEEVLAAKSNAPDAAPTGVVVRERVSARDAAAPATDRPVQGAGFSTQETDYQTGKRTEQVVSPAGQIKRLNVAVVVRPALDDAQIEKVRSLVAAAVGLNAQRGDAIAVQSMTVQPVASEPAASQHAPADDPAAPAAPGQSQAAVHTPALDVRLAIAALLGVAAAGVALVWLARRRSGTAPQVRALDDAGRAAVLKQVELWLHDGAEPQPAQKGGR